MDLLKLVDDARSATQLRSTAYYIGQSVKEAFWQDIQQELHAWLADSWLLMEQCAPEQLPMLQARCRTIREVLLLPDNLINVLEAKDESKRNTTN